MSDVNSQLVNYTIYVILSSRGAEPGFHWGIFIPTSKPTGDVWHAVNRSGGWFLEHKTTAGIPNSLALCLAFKVGTVSKQTWAPLQSTLGGVPSAGQPSRITGEAFTCRIWTKDALVALQSAGIIQLSISIAQMEIEAIKVAERHRPRAEQGIPAMVMNEGLREGS